MFDEVSSSAKPQVRVSLDELTNWMESSAYFLGNDSPTPQSSDLPALESMYSPEIPWGIPYSPDWMAHVFADRAELKPTESRNQEILELFYAMATGQLYTPEAIKLALHLNHQQSGEGRFLASIWYDHKAGTHPSFILNFMRFCLRNGFFTDLEELVNFGTSPEPVLLTKEILNTNKKLVLSPEELQGVEPDTPIAFIHGRFRGVPHLDHEAAVEALHKLKMQYPDLKVVVGVDLLNPDKGFANTMFRCSLFAAMPEVDYVMPIIFSLQALKNQYLTLSRSPIESLPEVDQDLFYENLYQRLYANREGAFLYVNPFVPTVTKKMLARCAKLGIIPVGREGNGIRWSSTLLWGDGFELPDKILHPFRDGEELHIDYRPPPYDGDPEAALEICWHGLADHLADTYAKDSSFANWFRKTYCVSWGGKPKVILV